MELNNTTKYAIRIVNYINRYSSDEKLYSARVLAEKLNINYKFLTTIMTKLVKAEILLSIRGKEGGFKLAKEPAEIFLMDIIEVFDDSFKRDACLLGIDVKCDEKKRCFLHDKWLKPKKEIYELFEGTSLADIKRSGEKF